MFPQIKQICSKGLQKNSGIYFCHIGKPYFKLFANIKFHYNKYVLFLKLNKSIILYQREEEINEPDFGNFSKCNEQVLCL